MSNLTLNLSNINFNSNKFRMVGGLTLDKVKIKYNWIFNAKIRDAIIGEDQNGLVWYSGTWENGTWENGTWYSGTFLEGRWKNGNVYSYDINTTEILKGVFDINREDISKTYFKNCSFENGNFNYGIFGSVEVSIPNVIDKDFVLNNFIDLPIENGFNTGANIGITQDNASSNVVNSIATYKESIYVGGGFVNYNNIPSNNILKLKNDGNVDTSFINGGFYGEIKVITVDDITGKIYVGGDMIRYNDVRIGRIIRLNPNGSIDTSFNTGVGFDSGTVNVITLHDDRIYVGGGITKYKNTTIGNIVRLLPNGEIDDTFITESGFSGIVYSICPYADKIYIGGDFSRYKTDNRSNIIKIDLFGIKDDDFNPHSDGFNGIVKTITSDSVGIYVGGSFTNFRSIPSNGILKLKHIDGTISTSFKPGGGFSDDLNLMSVNSVLLSDNKLIVCGNFDRYDGVGAHNLIILNTDGSVDKNYIYTDGFLGEVKCVSTGLTNDKLLVGGEFTEYDLTKINYLTRINITGGIDIDKKEFIDKGIKSIFKGGNFNDGLFNGGYFKGGNFNNGFMNNVLFIGGYFNNGYFLGGEFYGGVFNGGDFSNGNFHAGLFKQQNSLIPSILGNNYKKLENSVNWYGGDFGGGELYSVVYSGDIKTENDLAFNWYSGNFNNGEWFGGSFHLGNFNNGIMYKSTIHDITFNGGHIIDTICFKGVFNGGKIAGGVFKIVVMNNVDLGCEIK